jgi:RNA polymerase sigma factor (sigma-70 family)
MKTKDFNTRIVAIRPILVLYAHKFVTNKMVIDDLVQDTYMKALIYKDKYRDDHNLIAWLCTILKYTFINNYRKNQKKHEVIVESENISQLISTTQPLMSDEILAEQDLVKIIELVYANNRMAFQLYIRGYSYEEIANILEIKLGTVKSRIFKARKQMKNIINKET